MKIVKMLEKIFSSDKSFGRNVKQIKRGREIKRRLIYEETI